jgi:hypothetical protein
MYDLRRLRAFHAVARSLADLSTERFTAPPGGGFVPYRTLLDRLCADAGFEPDVAHEVNDVTIARPSSPPASASRCSPSSRWRRRTTMSPFGPCATSSRFDRST